MISRHRLAVSLPEMGVEGRARLVRLDPCPAIQPGPGSVVTGRFKREHVQALDLRVEGLAEPLGVTAAHPFWSEDRQGFIPAGELHVGERLRSAVGGPEGGLARVRAIVPRGPPEAVHNLEVAGEHVYQVAGSGLLVHNAYQSTAKARAAAQVGVQIHKRYSEVLETMGYIVNQAVGHDRLRPDAWKIIQFNGRPIAVIIRELKPGNARAVKKGEKELLNYNNAIMEDNEHLTGVRFILQVDRY